jgi:hypothetical protein
MQKKEERVGIRTNTKEGRVLFAFSAVNSLENDYLKFLSDGLFCKKTGGYKDIPLLYPVVPTNLQVIL